LLPLAAGIEYWHQLDVLVMVSIPAPDAHFRVISSLNFKPLVRERLFLHRPTLHELSSAWCALDGNSITAVPDAAHAALQKMQLLIVRCTLNSV
jgi:hypothetical protein